MSTLSVSNITGAQINVVNVTATTMNVVTANITGATVATMNVSSASVSQMNVTGTLLQQGTSNYPITQGSNTATTSGTSKDFTDIPSWVKRITIAFANVSMSSTDTLFVQIGDSGGLESTGYTSTGGHVINGAPSSAAIATVTTAFHVQTGQAAQGFYGHMILTLLADTTWVMSVSGCISNYALVAGGGIKTLSGTLDRLRILPSGANSFDAGSVNIMYE
jgi:hypothetical protein